VGIFAVYDIPKSSLSQEKRGFAAIPLAKIQVPPYPQDEEVGLNGLTLVFRIDIFDIIGQSMICKEERQGNNGRL